MLTPKEPDHITLAEGLKLLERHLPASDAKLRLQQVFIHKAIKSTPLFAVSYEDAEIEWSTGDVKIARLRNSFRPVFLRSDFLAYFFESPTESAVTAPPSSEGKKSVDRELGELFAEYDELASDVVGSRHPFFVGNVGRWLSLLDRAHYFARPVLQQLESSVDFKVWYAPYQTAAMTGSGKAIEWPHEPRKRLGIQLLLFRQFANGGVDSGIFALTLMHSGKNINDGIAAIVNQIFLPLSRELRRFLKQDIERYLRQEAERATLGEESPPPAPDGSVSPGHDKEAHTQISKAAIKGGEIQMNAVLLTGAGFSHNWGGRLAREINTAVALRLRDDGDLADLLRRNPNFEEALTELQNECATSSRPGAPERLQKLETAIIDAFAEMNANLAKASFNFCNDRRYSVIDFLALFDAIFTLNQDLLLESHYYNPPDNLSLTGTRKWLGGEWPATEVVPDPNRNGLFDSLTVRRKPKPSPQATSIDPQYQPYFKLHGSTNWHDPNGGRLLVMGGNKPTTIQRHPILMWYAAKFSEYLSRPHARLMVIGYGFRDDHINQLIYDAWQKGGKTLSMFIVHPDGREILTKIRPTYGKPLQVAGPLEEITVYDSTRQLRTTFGGNDPGEHDLLVGYAKGT